MTHDRKALRDFVLLYGAVQIIGTADAEVRAFRERMPIGRCESVISAPQCPSESRGPVSESDLDDGGIFSLTNRISSLSTSTSTST